MKPENILVGVCGGVAAYKALDVVSALRKQDHHVQVVMTEAATRFVQPLSFEAVSGHPVLQNLWPENTRSLEDAYPHLYPATECGLCVLIPATANTLAKIAGGFGSDVLSTSCLSLPSACKKLFCPSMNVEMWTHPQVQKNVSLLEQQGWTRVGPESGHLACGMTGEGRLSSVDRILSAVENTLSPRSNLHGKTVLILSGPTREHLDPVRYIGNPSSGRMGKALAEEAAQCGARVVCVSGPVPEENLPIGRGIDLIRVVSAGDMLEQARKKLPAVQAVIYAAAVSDYRPETHSEQKLPKHEEAFDVRLIPNPDIAATLNREKAEGTFTIGFALQTENGEAAAREKCSSKGLDGIVLNYPDSIGSAEGRFSFLGKGKTEFENWGRLRKEDAAAKIIAHLPGD